MLYAQNSPQFVIAFYAIVRAGCIVVPVNPMNTTEEIKFFIQDGEMKIAIVSMELYHRVEPLVNTTSLQHVIAGAYSDYISDLEQPCIPEEVKQVIQLEATPSYYLWNEVLALETDPGEDKGAPETYAVMPYTSGTTGMPKGCLHTHSSVQANTISAALWNNVTPGAVCLTTLPLFHVTGMVHSMLAPIASGAKMIIMTRWNREHARVIMKEHQVSHWINISTMLIDFLSNPKLSKSDMESLTIIGGGGAPLPAAVGEKLYSLTGLRFVEGYGLSETISHTHFNPPDRPKLQCLGIPAFDVDARIIDPATCEELPTGSEGEIVVHGPQIFAGYYNRDDENRQVFIEIEGKRFFRTGDIAKRDEEGYYFMVDRVKRMINASGFKVWPTEVESSLYKHPAVQQACVVGVPDPKRGETVKAFIILNESYKGKISEADIIEWAKNQMAAYKYPRYVEFRESLPTTSSGKLLWRKLQDEEKAKLQQPSK